jgi:hypothetical protein
MPMEGIPRTDWKPFQREVMRGWERLWTRDDHWLRIEKWKIRQQHTPDWVCLAQIADWCARRPGDIERDHRRRVQAYSDLQQSIMLGEFGEGSRLKVVYLEPQPPSLRDRVRLRLHTGYFRTEKVLDHVLDLCWAPRELCLRWLVARHIDAPPWLAAPRPPADAFEADTSSSSEPAHSREPNESPLKSTRAQGASAHPINPAEAEVTGASPVDRADPPTEDVSRIEPANAQESRLSPVKPDPTRARDERIHRALGKLYPAAPGKKPPNIKEVVRLVKADLLSTNETATWKVIQRCARDEHYAGMRRPPGKTFKSEQTRH